VDELSGRRMQSNLKAFVRLILCNCDLQRLHNWGLSMGWRGSHLSLLENVLTQSSP